MRYLISTTARNGAAECEANLRKLGAIGPGDSVQAFPKKGFPGAFDLYLVESTDLATRKATTPKPKTKQPAKRRAWFDNANLATAVVVALLLGLIFRSL